MTYHMIISNRENLRQIRSSSAHKGFTPFSRMNVCSTIPSALKPERITKAINHANRQIVVGYLLAGVLVMTSWMMIYGIVVS